MPKDYGKKRRAELLKHSTNGNTKEKNDDGILNFNVDKLRLQAQKKIGKAGNKIINKIQNKDFDTTKEKKAKPLSITSGCSQDMIPVRSIENGIIKTDKGTYVSIIEVYPINYEQLSNEAKNRALSNFGRLFSESPHKLQIKVMNDALNPSELINNILKNCDPKLQDNPETRKTLENYIGFISVNSKGNTLYSRYFIIYEYSGEDGNSHEDIVNYMRNYRQFISGVLISCGNYVSNNYDEEDNILKKILYSYYNRRLSEWPQYIEKTTVNGRTVVQESFEDRVRHIKNDFSDFRLASKKDIEPSLYDYLAPKGMDFSYRNYMIMDGYFYSFMGIKKSTFPGAATGAWLPYYFCNNTAIDMDIIIKKIPKQLVENSLKVMNRMSYALARDSAQKSRFNRQKNHEETLQNNSAISNALRSGQDLYDVAIIMTFKATTLKELKQQTNMFKKQMKSIQVEVDECFDCVEDYFLMTNPLLFITKPFSRLAHNMLTSQLESLYPFVNYQLFDPKGAMLGTNASGAVISINNFNTGRYSNANMIMTGASGAGKTFTTQMIATREYLNGIDCYFILPKKGYEYKSGANMVGGKYIKVSPGSEDSINIMEIRPEKNMDETMVDENVNILSYRESLLTKKIQTLITWLGIISKTKEFPPDIISQLVKEIMYLYQRYNITEDNNSIYENNDPKTGKLRDMPTILQLYQRLLQNPDLEDFSKYLQQYTTFKNLCEPTNVDLNSRYIVFDCEVNDDEIAPAMQYIAFDYCLDKIKMPGSNKSLIFMDEVWSMLKNRRSAKQIHDTVRVVRGYGAGTVIMSQEIEDFLKYDEDGFLRPILNNSSIKLFLQQEPEAAKKLCEVFNLSNKDRETLISFQRGQGMLVSKNDKFTINITPSQYEIDMLSDKTSKY